jgi:hypothetical protein
VAAPAAVEAHDLAMKRLQALAVAAGRAAWRRVGVGDISGSWLDAVSSLLPVVEKLQLRAAVEGSSYVVDALAEQGSYSPPAGFLDPRSLAGEAPDGRSLEGLLYSPATAVKSWIGSGIPPQQALVMGSRNLDMKLSTTISETGGVAAGMDIAARPRMGYVRMLNAPSCPKCVVLAGRWYRWNTGFLRHPRCDCRHIPAEENKSGDLTTDPYEYFKSLSREDQDRLFTKAGAKAINDGADISQVVNARRGMKYAGMSADGTRRGQNVSSAFTTEGTSRRGNFRANAPGGGATRGRRLTPEAIYELNGNDRAAALKDLEKYGYILPGGQNPLGSISGQREGFGALGHGGAYPAARKRVEDAIANGRDPKIRATMTEAERRLFDAKARWELVQQGVNPFSAPSMTSKAKVMDRPLTPAIAAQVEKDYRRWLATGGQIFTP